MPCQEISLDDKHYYHAISSFSTGITYRPVNKPRLVDMRRDKIIKSVASSWSKGRVNLRGLRS